jgi:hypothetical protein
MCTQLITEMVVDGVKTIGFVCLHTTGRFTIEYLYTPTNVIAQCFIPTNGEMIESNETIIEINGKVFKTEETGCYNNNGILKFGG